MGQDLTRLKTLSRRWLLAEGRDALRFLNGMWTADLKRAAAIRGCGYAYLLNSKGKAITEARYVAEGAERFLFSIPSENYDATFGALDRLKVADDFEWREYSEADAPYASVALVPQSPLDPPAEALEEAAPVPHAVDRVFRVIDEPWGRRVASARVGPRHEEWWIRTGAALPVAGTELDESEYAGLRIEAGVPEWSVDFVAEGLPLEFPIFDGISFHKGCYIGQEVIARATYRGQMPRGFCRVRAAAPLATGFVYAEADPERPVGKITTVAGVRGLGLLRIAAFQERGPEGLQATGLAGERVRLVEVENLLPSKPGA